MLPLAGLQELYHRLAGGPSVSDWDTELAINFSAHWLHRAVSPLFRLRARWCGLGGNCAAVCTPLARPASENKIIGIPWLMASTIIRKSTFAHADKNDPWDAQIGNETTLFFFTLPIVVIMQL